MPKKIRRRGDLNSRAAFTTYRISSATPSASWVLLHGSSIVRRYSSINHFFKKKFQIQKIDIQYCFHYTKRTLEVRFIAGSTDDIFQERFYGFCKGHLNRCPFLF